MKRKIPTPLIIGIITLSIIVAGVVERSSKNAPQTLLADGETATQAAWWSMILSETAPPDWLTHLASYSVGQPPFVVAQWVEYTPGKVVENMVCYLGNANMTPGGTPTPTYIGHKPCVNNIYKNFAGTDFPVTVVNGTPLLPGTTTPPTSGPATNTVTASRTPTKTNTASPTATKTITPTRTPTKTATVSPTTTKTNISPTLTATLIPTVENSRTPTRVSPTVTFTPTFIPTATITPTPTLPAPNNMCAAIQWNRPLSIRAMPDLYVPALGSYNAFTTVLIDGFVTINKVNNPNTTMNESISNGTWAKVNRGNFFPLKLNNGVTYALIEPCNFTP